MAIKTETGYECGYCHKAYAKPIDADNCKESHDLIYIAMSKEDLNRLVMFIFSKDENVLGDSIVERLQSYLKESVMQDFTRRANNG